MPPPIRSSSTLDLRFLGEPPHAVAASRPLPTQLAGVSVAAPDAANRRRASGASASPSSAAHAGNGGIAAALVQAGAPHGVEGASLGVADAAASPAEGTAAFDSVVGEALRERKVNEDIDRLISERGEAALPEAIALAASLDATGPDAKKSELFEGVTTARPLDRQVEKNGVELLLALGKPADAGALRQTLEQTKNATALFHITNFGLTLGLAYDQAQAAGDREKCAELAGLAEKYVKLIDQDGLGRKSTFGAFYLSEKGRGRERRLGLEKRLLELSGAGAKGGVKALQNQVLNSVVKPYLQEILNEKFGAVDAGTLKNCLGWIKSGAHGVFDAMAEEVVKDIKTDSGLGSLACMLKVALLAPKLLRDFRPEATPPSKAPAAPPSDGVPGADGVRDDDGRNGGPGVVFNGPVTITGSAVAIGAQGNMLSLDSHDGDSNVRNGGSGRRQSLNESDDSRDAPAPVDDSADRAEDASGRYDVSQLKDRGMPGESAPEAGGSRRPVVAAGLAMPEGLQLRRVPDTAPERQAAVLGDVELVRSDSNDDAVVLRRRSLGETPVFAPVVLPELAARLKPVAGATDRPALSFGGLQQNVTLRHWGERPPERRPRPVSWSGDYGRGRKVELTWNRETQSKAVPEYKHYFRDPALAGQSVPRAENRAGTENRQPAAALQDIRRQARRSSGGAEQA